ncbi:hypothetical protein GPJ56_000001 [Histomonas meleagridis]|uniref:uncharacterized protein n=1 Tax=Histomonas meleagridis TaxID=135588 RepID=UPI00355975A3|nr:hypothetical protein GPJ56_000001 [Histomonas meleagridis]KAH0804613.1 hypothetical protein GO595_002549 [Histomonas meleagridis]
MHTNSLSPPVVTSSLTNVRSELVFYDHRVVAYSSQLFTVVFQASPPSAGGITAPALTGIVCESAVAIVAGIVVFLVQSNKEKKESLAKMEFKDTLDVEYKACRRDQWKHRRYGESGRGRLNMNMIV